MEDFPFTGPDLPPEYREKTPRRKHPAGHHRRHPRPLSRTHAGITFLRITELLAVALSFLARSRIARFFTTKATLDFVVEFTALFGKEAGHRLSSFFALLAAEPALIAAVITGFILLIELIRLIVRRMLRH